MFNILKMHLYRARKSKLAYIIPIVMVLIVALFFGVLVIAENISAFIPEDSINMPDGFTVERTTSIDFFTATRSVLSGGFIPIMVTAFVLIFLGIEHSTGYDKNLVGCYDNKLSLVGANILLGAIYTVILYIVSLAVIVGFSYIFYDEVTYSAIKNLLLYIGVTALETVAFLMLMMLFADLIRNNILVMILGLIYCMYSTLLYQLVDMLVSHYTEKRFNIAEYTVIGGFSALGENSDLKSFLLSGCIALAVVILSFFLDTAVKQKLNK